MSLLKAVSEFKARHETKAVSKLKSRIKIK